MFTRAARMSPGQVPGTDRRRVLTLLGATSAVGSIGLAAGGTAGALLGARLAGTEAAAGLPLGLLVLGSGAFALLVTANFVMVAVMAVAPVHLMSHGQALGGIGIVIALHVAGMFAPAPLSGWLADRTGPPAVATIGCLLILLAGVGGAVIDQNSGRSITLILAVLGIGWNFSVVGASTLIARSVPAGLRVHVEGIGEVAMALAAAIGAPAAGLIIVSGGFTALALTATVITALAVVASTRHLSPTRHALPRDP